VFTFLVTDKWTNKRTDRQPRT